MANKQGIDQKLLRLLACTGCRGELAVESDKNRLVCKKCGHVFSIENGVPMMHRIDSRENSPQEDLYGRKTGLRQRIGSFIGNKCLPPAPVYDPDKISRIGKFIAGLGDGSSILDMGSGMSRWHKEIVNLDVVNRKNVSVVGDAQELPFADGSFDGIICNAVIPHTVRPRQVAREMHRVLKPGGRVYIAAAFIHSFVNTDGYEDVYRFTITGLQRVFAEFREIESGIIGGPSSAIANILREYLPLLFFDNWSTGYNLSKIFAGWCTFWIKYIDIFTAKRKLGHRISSGFYFIGEK